MKYFSEVTHQYYDTEKACLEAEFKVKEAQNKEKILRERAEREAKEKKVKLAAERKARAAEVEDARKAMDTARSHYAEVLQAFCRDYGAYHTSLTGEDAQKVIPTLFNIFNPLLFDI